MRHFNINAEGWNEGGGAKNKESCSEINLHFNLLSYQTAHPLERKKMQSHARLWF